MPNKERKPQRKTYRVSYHPIHHKDIIEALERIPQSLRGEYIAIAIKTLKGALTAEDARLLKSLGRNGNGDDRHEAERVKEENAEIDFKNTFG